nr:MAG TPA: hypothetical protein [Caudoviricetes sp.]
MLQCYCCKRWVTDITVAHFLFQRIGGVDRGRKCYLSGY